MACGSCGGGARRVNKFRVTFNDNTQKDYLTKGEAEAARTAAGATRPVRLVSVTAAPPAPSTGTA